MMRLGIVVTDDRLADDATAFSEEAQRRQWPVRCFLTDRGVLLLKDKRFRTGVVESDVPVAVCELSLERYGMSESEVPSSVVVGGQYQDAELVKNSDRVLVL